MAQNEFLFPTPLIRDVLASEEGLAQLRAAIMAQYERDPEGIQVSNVGGWHSKTDMIEWGGEAARALAHKAMQLADAGTVDVRAPDDSRFGWIPEMWANVSHAGHANQYHCHPGAFWSAVAYIDDGYQGSDDPALGGELQLLDPRMPMVRMTAPDLRLVGESGAAQVNEVLLRPKSGTIVMFPSWLQHAVRAYHGDGVRISIAINLIPALKRR